MKKIITLLFIFVSLIIFGISTIKAGAQESELSEENANSTVSSLFTDFYDDGVYTKETKIYVDTNKKELVEEIKFYFHASVPTAERTTYYSKDALWMSRGNGEYSYYGTAYNGNETVGVTNATATTPYETPVNAPVVLKGEGKNSMEEYYVTLKDFSDNPGTSWVKEGAYYLTNDEVILDNFRLFTAPLWLDTEKSKNYIVFCFATVEVVNCDLVMKLWVSDGDIGKLTETETATFNGETYYVFSKATILHDHEYTNLNSDSFNHWNECACGEKNNITNHTGGTATTTEHAICDVCNTPYGDLVPTYLGTFGASNVEAYAALDGNILTMRHEVAEGIMPGEINQFFIFDNDVVYEVRFNQTGITVIVNWANDQFLQWDGRIGIPTYTTIDGKYVMTQVIDLSYFTDLGLDVSTIKFNVGENLAGETHLMHNGVRVDFNNHSTWVDLKGVLSGEAPSEPVVSEVYLGTFGASNVQAYATLDGNILTMRHEVAEGIMPGEINQFFIFDNDVVYEVRFNQTGITVIVNWANDQFLQWDGRIGIPTYTTIDGKYVMTQVIDLSYFTDLGLDVSTIKFNVGENLAGETHLMHNGVRVDFNNHSTWVNLTVLFNEVFLGTVGVSNVKTYYLLEGNILTMRHEVTEGIMPGEIGQFITFANGMVFEVKFNQAGWTGIFDLQIMKWALYGERVGHPTFSTYNGKYVMTQVIDLTYFSDLGADISSFTLEVVEYK